MQKNYFSSNLKVLLGHEGMSQEHFAEKIGKKRSVVGSYIRNESQPNIDMVVQIADIFGIDVSDLICKDLSKQEYEAREEPCEMVAEDNAPYEPEYLLFKKLFSRDDDALNKKFDILIAQNTKILDRLDRDILKDAIKAEREKLKKNQKK